MNALKIDRAGRGPETRKWQPSKVENDVVTEA
jgi:hypothetical protein